MIAAGEITEQQRDKVFFVRFLAADQVERSGNGPPIPRRKIGNRTDVCRRSSPILLTGLRARRRCIPRSSRFGTGSSCSCPWIYPPVIPGRAMIARHDDAEALARVLRRFGLGLIHGRGVAFETPPPYGPIASEAIGQLVAMLQMGAFPVLM
jgi:hypothetical protein